MSKKAELKKVCDAILGVAGDKDYRTSASIEMKNGKPEHISIYVDKIRKPIALEKPYSEKGGEIKITATTTAEKTVEGILHKAIEKNK